MSNSQVLNSHNFRFACKEFSDQIISQENFEIILNSARLSPSAIGLEPWSFLVVQNKELRQKLAPLCGGGYKQLNSASHFVIILARKLNSLKPNSDYIKHILSDIKNMSSEEEQKFKEFLQNYLDTRFKADELERELYHWSEKQCYITLANMLTTAAQLEIDSCPIGGFEKTKVEELLAKEGILDSQNFGVCCMASFGYRKDDNVSDKKRLPLNEIVKWV